MFWLHSGADPEILKRGDALFRPPWLTNEDNFRFKMVWKVQNNVTDYQFYIKYFNQHFQIFSIFIYNERLPMKSYQFFKIYKRFDKERNKTLMQQSIEMKNWEKLDFVF